jgi:hypothetical protein
MAITVDTVIEEERGGTARTGKTLFHGWTRTLADTAGETRRTAALGAGEVVDPVVRRQVDAYPTRVGP